VLFPKSVEASKVEPVGYNDDEGCGIKLIREALLVMCLNNLEHQCLCAQRKKLL
jgi:hypothetical protein